jgi:Predicted glycosyl transferase
LRSIVYYITGHGFGHAVRSNLVIQALSADSEVRIHVRTTAPEWLFYHPSLSVSYESRAIDVGIIQPNSLHMDLAATVQACSELHNRLPVLIEQEIEFLKRQNVQLIIGDIPPACFEIASRANLPSVAITNFTWDVIYRAYAGEHPELTPLIAEMAGFYEKATLALTLPYPCDMSGFPRREAIPWIARVSSLDRAQARAAFGLPQTGSIVLLSFGGLGIEGFPWHRLNQYADFFFVTTGPVARSRDNLLVLDDAQLHYEDLLRAVDVIVTKPGYGIVADLLAHRLPVLYTERGEFAEYPFLVRALNDLATAEFIPQDDLLAGDIGPYLIRLLGRSPNWPVVPLNGASAAARAVITLLH